MIHVLHVIDQCIMLRCDIVLHGVHHADHRYGDHRYHSLSTLCDNPNVLRVCDSITSVCSEMISYMFSCNCYSHMKLYFYDSCSTCYRFMLNATIRYCIVWEPSIWESSIWGPLIWGPSYGDHLMGTIDIRRYQYEELE